MVRRFDITCSSGDRLPDKGNGRNQYGCTRPAGEERSPPGETEQRSPDTGGQRYRGGLTRREEALDPTELSMVVIPGSTATERTVTRSPSLRPRLHRGQEEE